jgi:hypothetical protein
MSCIDFTLLKSRITKLPLAIVATAILLTPSSGQAQPKPADVTWPVVVINRSITKLDLTVWDENDTHKQLLKQIMEAGQEVTIKAAVKAGQRSLAWKVVALDDRGWKLPAGQKRPTRCGTGTATDAKTKLEVSSQPNVPGKDC